MDLAEALGKVAEAITLLARQNEMLGQKLDRIIDLHEKQIANDNAYANATGKELMKINEGLRRNDSSGDTRSSNADGNRQVDKIHP